MERAVKRQKVEPKSIVCSQWTKDIETAQAVYSVYNFWEKVKDQSKSITLNCNGIEVMSLDFINQNVAGQAFME